MKKNLKKQLGLTELTGGENNYPYPEKINSRPTLELNGIIPNEAHAKITCRLVKNQNPEKIQG
jgi:hypothetical protein